MAFTVPGIDLTADLPEALPDGESSVWLDAWNQVLWDPRLLDPRGSAQVSAGCRPGVARTSQAGFSSSTPDQTYRNKTFTSGVTLNAAATGALFVNCSFQAANFQPYVEFGVGTGLFAVSVNGAITTGRPIFIDCEFYGGTTCSIQGGGYFVACYAAEGADVVNLRGDTVSTFAHCVIDGPKKATPSSHSDGIQSTTNSPSTTIHRLEIWRSRVSANTRLTGEHCNRAVQLGSYGDPAGGCLGWVKESWLGGGSDYCVAWESGAGQVVYSDNFAGRDTTNNITSWWYGGTPTDPLSVNNVWDDDGSPVT